MNWWYIYLCFWFIERCIWTHQWEWSNVKSITKSLPWSVVKTCLTFSFAYNRVIIAKINIKIAHSILTIWVFHFNVRHNAAACCMSRNENTFTMTYGVWCICLSYTEMNCQISSIETLSNSSKSVFFVFILNG